MAVTHSEDARNGMADVIDDKVNGGTTDANGDLVVFATSTELVRIPLQNPAFDAAAAGQIDLQGVPLSAAAVASGTANRFEVQNRDNAMVFDGSITATGGGGDMTVDNTSVAAAQNVQCTGMIYAAAP